MRTRQLCAHHPSPYTPPSKKRSFMIPTSTRAVVQVAKAPPASADAVAVFVHKQFKAADAYPSLPQSPSETLNRLISSGHVRGKSNEVVVQLMEGSSRLVVIGMGDAEKFSAEC